ncbi:MAG TPA: hypothetical protein VFY36_06400 [Solirubrobacteraceae bacterium]|nr:hypothetical protein [Solirubrobacteraceae bacterium]
MVAQTHSSALARASAATTRSARRSAARAALAAAVACAALVLGGCGTGHPKAISAAELAEAQTFPYYTLYWVGPRFEGHPLAAADGLNGYLTALGDSVYYGDCVQNKGLFGSGTCVLPLQVTTVLYRLHSNAALGPQRNMLLRGVPATTYDDGRSIEIYSGRVAIDVFSDTFAHALRAARRLRPLNAPGSASGPLPAPIYCPGLSGPQEPALRSVMASLPGRVCQITAERAAYAKSLTGASG